MSHMFRRSGDHVKYPLVTPSRVTRANKKLKFYIPKPNNEKFKSFPLYQGAYLWDHLSADTQRCDSYLAFKKRI